MTGRSSPQGSTRTDRVHRHRGSLVGLLATVCGATLALGGTATARPLLEDEELDGPRVVLGGRGSLATGELAEGGWSIVTDMPDRLALVAGPARVRIIVDASVDATPGDPRRSTLVAALDDTAGLTPPRYVTRPVGVFVVFDADHGLNGATVTGEGDATVVLGTPRTVERVYVVTRGAGNLLVEAQAPLGTDGGTASLDAMDALVMTLVPEGAQIDDDLSPIAYAHR